mmetsp:Transcript_15399/g.29010  ORF Transcript_15399/g.29010 Transcript_15399/m.29010 type:complete len:369 (+) Transcript_15399:335-1441(+)
MIVLVFSFLSRFPLFLLLTTTCTRSVHGLLFPKKLTSLTIDTTTRISATRLHSLSKDGCLLVFGNGNVGKEVLGGLATDVIPGTCIKKCYCTFRNERPLDKITGVQYIEFNEAWKYLSDCTHLLITIPPVMSEDSSSYSDPILDNESIMSHLPPHAWIGYISTTGVYGNHDGALVDESSLTLCKPMTKAFAYLDIEKRWQKLQQDDPSRRVFIFRSAGLYGNTMSALHTVLHNGMEDEGVNNIKSQEVSKTSRVHFEDVSRIIIASMKMTKSLEGGIYNLADSYPAARNEVMQYAKYLLSESNLTIPETLKTSNPISERKKRRNSDRKIVSNKKMLAVLSDYGGLLFPSYREGLWQILQNNLEHWKQL